MKRSSIYHSTLLILLILLLMFTAKDAYTQSTSLCKLESISFSPKKWTVPQLISAIQQGASGVQRLSPSSKVSYTPEQDMEDHIIESYYSFAEEGIELEFSPLQGGDIPFQKMMRNGMNPLSEVRSTQKGAEFTVNGQVIKVGNLFDDYPWLTIIEQSKIPIYKPRPDIRCNYAILIAEDGSGLFIRSSEGWGSRIISEITYAPNVYALRIFDILFTAPLSQIELEYIVGEANKIIKKGTYMTDILEQMNGYLSSAIDISGASYYTLAEQRTFLAQAKAEREAGQKAAEEAKRAKWLEDMRLEQEKFLKENPKVIKDIIREEKQRGRVY